MSFVCFVVFFVNREYPCDHYTSVINVTLLMTGCPRVEVHSTALQLLQVLDKRFFGNVGPLHSEGDKGRTKYKIYLFIFQFSLVEILIYYDTFDLVINFLCAFFFYYFSMKCIAL